MKLSARLLAAIGVNLMALGLINNQAVADYFGSLTLKPGEARQLYIGTTARNLRVCNDFFSSGSATVTIGDNFSHELLPGVCAEDIGDRMTIHSHASGQVRIDYRAIYDQGHGQFYFQ